MDGYARLVFTENGLTGGQLRVRTTDTKETQRAGAKLLHGSRVGAGFENSRQISVSRTNEPLVPLDDDPCSVGRGDLLELFQDDLALRW